MSAADPAVATLRELADPRAWRFADRSESKGVRNGPTPDAPRIARRDGRGHLSVGELNAALRSGRVVRSRYVDAAYGRVFVYALPAAAGQQQPG